MNKQRKRNQTILDIMIIRFKTHRKYHSPRVITAEVDSLAALCTSVRFNVEVDELHNINADESYNGTEEFYFEF